VTIVDLLAGVGRGPIWGDATEELNVTLLAWPPGEGPAAHDNDERDVVIVVAEGTARVVLDGMTHDIRSGHVVVVPRGATRALTAGPDGVRYLSIHRRRGGLQIRRSDERADAGIATPEIGSAGYSGALPAGGSVALTGSSCESSARSSMTPVLPRSKTGLEDPFTISRVELASASR
jgi:hypothetical protein